MRSSIPLEQWEIERCASQAKRSLKSGLCVNFRTIPTRSLSRLYDGSEHSMEVLYLVEDRP